MSISNFIPSVWSARLLENLNNELVYANVACNRDYEGDIRAYGDTVKINAIGDVTVFDYTKGTDMTAPQELNSSQTTLQITQAKAFNFSIDDVDTAQQNPKIMDAAMAQAAFNLAETADDFIASQYLSAGLALGDDTTPIVPTASTAYEIFIDAGVKLSENNVPKVGRYAIVAPWLVGMLQKDTRFVASGADAADNRLVTGLVGHAAGFTIYESNNVPNTTGAKYKLQFGHPMAITYATQIAGVEGYRPEKRFSDAVKGLHLYGAKVIRPNALLIATCNKA